MSPNALSLFNYFSFTRLSAGLLYHETIVFTLAPGFAKIAPWCLARQDKFVAKEPGLSSGVTAPPTLSAHTREPLGLRRHCSIIWLPTHQQEFG
jgi:hypothetical protein